MSRMLFFAILVFVFGSLLCPARASGEYLQAPLAMHIASTVSDGCLSIAQIVTMAKQNNFRAVVINDHDLARWEYGIWPLYGLIKRVVQGGSIFHYGIRRYLRDIQEAARQHPDMVTLGGTESAPFYYWEGDPLRRTLTMRDSSVHLLVIGLKKPEDYARLPVIGNPAGAGKRFDQYHGDQGARPYQQFIDYVRTQGGLVFWAHPETTYEQRGSLVTIRTADYSYDLLRTDRYTGFEIYYEGDQKVGAVGGIWDEVLGDYCAGRRSHPVWALAGSGFDKNGSFDNAMTGVRTVLLVNKLNEDEVLTALRLGRMYALKGSASGNFVLDSFVARNAEGTIVKTMGEEFIDARPALIEISGHFLDGQETPLTIQLIKNGQVMQVFREKAPFHVFFEDLKVPAQGARSYYRVQIDASQLSVATNPIFVSR